MVGVPDNRRTLLTKKMICNSYLELAETMPLNKITVTAITKKANVNRGTFYRYYVDPDDLFAKIEHEFANQLLQRIQLTATQSIDSWLDQMLSFMQDHRQTARIVLRNSTGSLPLNEVIESLRPMAEKLFVRRFKTMDQRKLLGYYIFFVSGTLQMIRQWLDDEKPLTIEEMTQLLLSIYVQQPDY